MCVEVREIQAHDNKQQQNLRTDESGTDTSPYDDDDAAASD